MKKVLFLLAWLASFALSAQSSSDFNTQLTALAGKVIRGVTEPGVVKIAVWDFTDLEGGVSNIGRYISEEVTVSLVNSNSGFKIIDRFHLEQILKEHNLKAEGLIDITTAKELGRIQAVDAIVTGTVTVLGDNVRIVMHVLHTESGAIVSSGNASFAMDDVIRSLLGISGGTTGSTSGDINRGFNAPLNSNEIYNNPSLVAKDCAVKKIGDYCFVNSTKSVMKVTIEWKEFPNDVDPRTRSGYKKSILKPGETSCFYSLYATQLEYKIEWNRTTNANDLENLYSLYANGYVMVEACKSKSFIIK